MFPFHHCFIAIVMCYANNEEMLTSSDYITEYLIEPTLIFLIYDDVGLSPNPKIFESNL